MPSIATILNPCQIALSTIWFSTLCTGVVASTGYPSCAACPVAVRGLGHRQDVDEVRGTVRDERGRPVAGASIVVRSAPPRLSTPQRNREWNRPGADIANSNSRGEFAVPPREHGFTGCLLIAFKPGHSPAAIPLDEFLLARDDSFELDVTLGSSAVCKGRVFDPQGRPVEGARVTLQGWISADEANDYTLCASPHFSGFIEQHVDIDGVVDVSVTTTRQGRFQLPDMPTNDVCILRISHPHFEDETVFWTATEAGAVVRPHRWRIFEQEVLQDEIEIVLEERPVYSFTLRFPDESRQPEFRLAYYVNRPYFESRARHPVEISPGRAELRGPQRGRFELYLAPPASSGLAGARVPFDIDPETPQDLGPIDFETGQRVNGRVVDAVNGLPLRNVRLQYFSDDPESLVRRRVDAMIPLTDGQGRAEFVVPRGAGEVRIETPVPGYEVLAASHQRGFPLTDEDRRRFVRRIELGVADHPLELEFALRPLATIRATVFDPDGRVSPRTRYGVHDFGERRNDSLTGLSDELGQVNLNRLFSDPRFPYEEPRDNLTRVRTWNGVNESEADAQHRDGMTRIVFVSKSPEWAAVAAIPRPPADEESLAIEAYGVPMAHVVGWLVDESSGEPIPNVLLTASYFFGAARQRVNTQAKSDLDGTFSLPIVPEMLATVTFDERAMKLVDPTTFAFWLRSGETLSVGEVQGWNLSVDAIAIDVPQVDGVEFDEALARLVQAATRDAQPIRQTLLRPAVQRTFNDARERQCAMLANAYGREFVNLSKQQIGTPREMKALIALLEHLPTPMNESRWHTYATDRLLDQYLNEPEALAVTRRLVIGKDDHRTYRYQLILENSQSENDRAAACTAWAAIELRQLQLLVTTDVELAEINYGEQLIKTERILDRAFRDYPEASARRLRLVLEGAQRDIARAADHGNHRAQQVLDLLAKYQCQ